MEFKSDTRLRKLALGSSEKGDDIEELLDLNDLTYTLPKNLSLASARNLKVFHAQRSTYSNTETSMIFTIQTGAQYINFASSSLQFKLQAAGGTWDFGKGSCVNIFKEIIVTSRSGQELCRLDKLNVFRLHDDRLNMSSEELASVGSLMGYDMQGSTPTPIAPATNVKFVVPMNKLCGLFDSKKLMPSWLSSGMRIELRLESVETALVGAGVSGYTISDPILSLDTFLLNDGASKKLNEISARNGLEYVFKSHHAITDSFSTSSTNIDVNKAVSRALGAMAISRKQSDIGVVANDSLKSETFNFSQSQWRLGSSYFPHQPLSDDREHYWNTLYTTEKLGSAHPSSVSLADYTSDYGVLTANLERSNVLAHSGSPINNSISLSLDARFKDVHARQMVVFLEYVSIARIFISNTSLLE